MSLDFLSFTHVPQMPDLYMPFDTCEALYDHESVAESKLRRIKRKKRQQERTEALAVTNNSASYDISNSQHIDMTSSALRMSPKPNHSENTLSPEWNNKA